MSVFWYQVYQARLWECLLTSRGLPSDSTCVLKAEPGKLDIKRREPGILFISNTLQTSDYDVFFFISVLIQRHWRRHSKSATSSWPDKRNMPWDRKRLLGYVETIQLILGWLIKLLNKINHKTNDKAKPNQSHILFDVLTELKQLVIYFYRTI